MSTDLQEPVIDDQAVLKNLAANISRRMKELGISQNGLARLTGDAVMTINGIVNEQHLPRGGILARIAEALQTNVDALIYGAEKKSRRAS